MPRLARTEKKALALHRWLAQRVRDNPALVFRAKERIDWLMEMNPAGMPYYRKWNVLLDGPLDVLLDVMICSSEHACALRQESPFVDLVDQRERARIFKEATSLDPPSKP
jgi:hypothetical protein